VAAEGKGDMSAGCTADLMFLRRGVGGRIVRCSNISSPLT